MKNKLTLFDIFLRIVWGYLLTGFTIGVISWMAETTDISFINALPFMAVITVFWPIWILIGLAFN